MNYFLQYGLSPLFCTKLFIVKKTCLFALILLVLAACQRPKGFDYRGIRNLSIENSGTGKSSLSLDLDYYNPNDFNVSLKKVNCDVFINKNYLGKFKLDTLIHIAKRSEFFIPAKMDVDLKDILKNSFAVILNKEVLVSVKGSTRVGKSGIFITIPFDYEVHQKIEF